MIIVFTVVTIASFGLLGFFYKLASYFKEDSLGIAFFLFLVGTILVGGYQCIDPYLVSVENPLVFVFGICIGIMQAFAVLCLLRSVDGVGLGISFTLSNFSILLPILNGLIIHQDPINNLQIFGMIISPLSVIAIGLDLTRRSKQPGFNVSNKKSFIILLFVFLLNGMSSVLVTEIKYHGLLDNRLVSMLMMYAFGALILGITQLIKRKRWTFRTVWIGTGTAFGSVFGTYFAFEMLKYLEPSITYPLLSMGQLMLLTFIGWSIFKEQYGIRTLIGIAVAIVSITLLNQ